MLKSIKTAILSAMIGMGAIAAVPATADAGNLTVEFRGGGHHYRDRGAGFGLYFGDSSRTYRRDHRDRDYRHDRPRYKKYRSCSPHRAVRKAERMGLRRARIGHVNHRTIGVKGRRHGHRAYVVFARAPRCPVLY